MQDTGFLPGKQNTFAVGQGTQNRRGAKIDVRPTAFLGNRIGVSAFFESLPSLDASENMRDYWRPFGIPLQCFGMEVTFWF